MHQDHTDQLLTPADLNRLPTRADLNKMCRRFGWQIIAIFGTATVVQTAIIVGGLLLVARLVGAR